MRCQIGSIITAPHCIRNLWNSPYCPTFTLAQYFHWYFDSKQYTSKKCVPDCKVHISEFIQLWLGAEQAPNHYLNQWWPSFTDGYMHPQWVNSLWPSEAVWWQRSGSTLVQVMACCLTAPSHYLNQCWLIVSKVPWHSSVGNFTRDTKAINHWN